MVDILNAEEERSKSRPASSLVSVYPRVETSRTEARMELRSRVSAQGFVRGER